MRISIIKSCFRIKSNPDVDPTFAGMDRSPSSSTTQEPKGSRPSRLGPPQDKYTSSPPATQRPNSSSIKSPSIPSEAPPAYTLGPAQPSILNASPSVPTSTDSDPYAFLKSFDTVFLIDDSGSMVGRSWEQTGAALRMITSTCTERDADGIDIYFLNHSSSSLHKNITAAGTVVEIFETVRPGGTTPTGQRLHEILKPYLKRYKKNPETTKPINIIVITDGAPSDDVESPIVQAAQKLDNLEAPLWQIGIQFFQVGKEPGAREHLKQLDDGLKELAGDEELRDMVDTVPFTDDDNAELTAAGILKCVLGSVNRRLDRKSDDLHRKD